MMANCARAAKRLQRQRLFGQQLLVKDNRLVVIEIGVCAEGRQAVPLLSAPWLKASFKHNPGLLEGTKQVQAPAKWSDV